MQRNWIESERQQNSMQIPKKMVRSGMRKRKRKLVRKILIKINNSELRKLLREKKKSFKQICGRKKWESISKGTSPIDIRAKRPGNK